MTQQDPNVEQLELVADALGQLREQLVFVGGCAAGLLITDRAAPPVRVTLDVDLLVSATTCADYQQVERQFESLDFKHDISQDAPICRWVRRGIKVDLMPTDPSVLGFSNRWYPAAAETALSVTLPSGQQIRLISGPAFLATKFEAFLNRGKGDLLASHDLEDILNVILGRVEIIDEVARAPSDIRSYLAVRCRELLTMRDFEYSIFGILQDETDEERTRLVLERMRAIAGGNA